MTTQRLPTFDPSADYRPFRVTVEDDEGLRFTVRIPHALGPRDALNLAKERVWEDNRMEVIGVMAEPDPGEHDACGFAWSIHDNRDPNSIMPFGCPPSERVAVERWGRE